jgi:putative ATP-binding cassette transporter
MQIASAFGRVQDALAWFVDNYDNLAAWRATTDRLTGFETALSDQKVALPSVEKSSNALNSGLIQADSLSLALPDGTPLLANESFRVQPGVHVLVQGPSGCGKSTLFRAIAGIWPFAHGRVNLPADAMFLPQRPYFPNGVLRAALAYPEAPGQYRDEALQQALIDAHLPQLAGRLDDSDAWNQKLSGGEQQRLAIARVLLRRPRWVFADEATSALDPATEAALYTRLTALTAAEGGAVVSIAHRPGLAAHHAETWRFEPAPGPAARWRLQAAASGA